jgi:chromosome segregation ATPase
VADEPASTQQDSTIEFLEVALNEVQQRFIAHSMHLSAERETHQQQLQDTHHELESTRTSLGQKIHDLEFSVQLTQDRLASASKDLEDTTSRLQVTDSALDDAHSQIGALTSERDQLEADGEAARARIDELTSETADLRANLEAQERENASLQAHVRETDALLATTNETAASTEAQLRQQLADAEKVTQDLIERHQAEQQRTVDQYQAKMAKLEAKLRSLTTRGNSGDSVGPSPRSAAATPNGVGPRSATPNSMGGEGETSSGLWNMALSWSRLASRPPNATQG